MYINMGRATNLDCHKRGTSVKEEFQGKTFICHLTVEFYISLTLKYSVYYVMVDVILAKTIIILE